MKRQLIIRGVMLVTAVVLGVLIIRRDSLHDVTPCSVTPGCVTANSRISGTFTTTQYGFPAAYRTTQAFRPTQGADYKEMTITQRTINIPIIVINVIFWFCLLDTLWRTRMAIRMWYKRRFMESAASEKPAG